MYLQSQDYQTIWKLSHNWSGVELGEPNTENLSQDLKTTIQRIMNAAILGRITVRNKRGQIFWDDSVFTLVFDFSHYRKFGKCLRHDIFDPVYLDSLYVKRPEVLSWCQKDYLSQPPIWSLDLEKAVLVNSYDASDDENHNWYDGLTESRKKRVACLEIAKKLWLSDENQTYEEIYSHQIMKQFGNPSSFSFDAFKKWARPFAPEEAKIGGRPIKNK